MEPGLYPCRNAHRAAAFQRPKRGGTDAQDLRGVVKTAVVKTVTYTHLHIYMQVKYVKPISCQGVVETLTYTYRHIYIKYVLSTNTRI